MHDFGMNHAEIMLFCMPMVGHDVTTVMSSLLSHCPRM